LTVVTGGAFEERMLYKTDQCGVGHVRYQPAGEPHTNRFWTEASCLQFEFDASWLTGIEQADGHLLFPGAVKDEQVSTLGRRLAAETERLDACSRLVLEPLVIEIILRAANTRRAFRNRVPSWLKQVRELIRDSNVARPTLAQIAQTVDIHPVHLCREFHRHYRCTIGEMIRKDRVEHACVALRSNLPLVEVALSSGFSDQSHMCSTFKRELGITPAEYRVLHSDRPRTNVPGRSSSPSARPDPKDSPSDDASAPANTS